MGVSQKLMTRALSQATGIAEPDLAHRLMGTWRPDSHSFASLVTAPNPEADLSRPYPFCLAHGLDGAPDTLGDPAGWTAEWKWDGIRGQLILRAGQYHLWSRGEELISGGFPEFARAVDFLPPGTVLDGELVGWQDEKPMPFNALQGRIGRKTVSAKLLAATPVVLLAYDLLEQGGVDIRDLPFEQRSARLRDLLAPLPSAAPLRLPPEIGFETWDDLARVRDTSRAHMAEGLMLKRRASPYLAGRRRGDWWKWKIAPLTVDAVMIYAQSGHGRRANLFTDFTFAVRDGENLVPFTKAYSGLSDAEFTEITKWVRQNTLQRFGPVRQVTPHHVFEIAFEGIQASTRHKSGVALRFPRMARWRQDKPASEIDTLDTLKTLLATYG